MKKLRTVEISLLFGVLFALIWGSGTAHAQNELSDSLIRLHVIANSDSSKDQEHKLAVRDAILTLVSDWGAGAENVEEMKTILSSNLLLLEEAGEEILRERGCHDPVNATVTDCHFPTKDYNGFCLPAGSYTALRIEIGNAEGANWWCVAFPPLCIGSSAENMEEAVRTGFFTREQVEFISGSGNGYILKFRSMELLGRIKAFVFNDRI